MKPSKRNIANKRAKAEARSPKGPPPLSKYAAKVRRTQTVVLPSETTR